MADSPVQSASFTVANQNRTVIFTGPVGASAGMWGDFTVYPLDFHVCPTGIYTITITGAAAGASPAFPVDHPVNLYSGALANGLYFYQNERDGANYIPTPLRTAPGHLNDANTGVYLTPTFSGNDNIVGNLTPTGATIDAAGGWWDAGDYVKFVQTTSYTVAIMLIGIRDFPNQLGMGAANSDFTAETKFGIDFLNKMWDDSTHTLYYQVGIGTGNSHIISDHDLWRLPQADDTYGGTDPLYQYIRQRPVFIAAPAGSAISPNLAGRLAADFAGCYIVYRATDTNYANRCLLAAEHVFDLADTSPSGDLLTVAPFDFYPETEWRDDLELGATELYFALQAAGTHPPQGLPHTDPMFYLRAAADWANAYITGPNDATDTLNLYDVSGLAHFELYRAITLAGNPAGLAVTKTDLLNDMEKALGNAFQQAATDPFGFGFPWAAYDTATHGAGLSVMAKELRYLTGQRVYEVSSKRWLANIMGANAWGSGFIAGDGSTFPNCMQHQVANIVGSQNGEPPRLNGALVEGPNTFAARGFLTGMRVCPPGGTDPFAPFNGNGAVYRDFMESYSTVEPAIDLTAASLLMFAWRIAHAPAPLP
jgi:endoglucanase